MYLFRNFSPAVPLKELAHFYLPQTYIWFPYYKATHTCNYITLTLISWCEKNEINIKPGNWCKLAANCKLNMICNWKLSCFYNSYIFRIQSCIFFTTIKFLSNSEKLLNCAKILLIISNHIMKVLHDTTFTTWLLASSIKVWWIQ